MTAFQQLAKLKEAEKGYERVYHMHNLEIKRFVYGVIQAYTEKFGGKNSGMFLMTRDQLKQALHTVILHELQLTEINIELGKAGYLMVNLDSEFLFLRANVTARKMPDSHMAEYFGVFAKTLDDMEKEYTDEFCMDCGKPDIEFYMVNYPVWQKAVGSGKGRLCVSCLEKRLGRELTPKDFYDNDIVNRELMLGIQIGQRTPK